MKQDITPEALERAMAAARKALSPDGEPVELPSRVYDAIIAGALELLAAQPTPDLDYTPDELDRTAPARIWLQIDTTGDNSERGDPWAGSEGVTWQDEPVGGLEIEYVRADLAVEPSEGREVRALYAAPVAEEEVDRG